MKPFMIPLNAKWMETPGAIVEVSLENTRQMMFTMQALVSRLKRILKALDEIDRIIDANLTMEKRHEIRALLNAARAED